MDLVASCGTQHNVVGLDVDYFVGQMGLLEKDPHKCKKITDLELMASEWNQVKLLLELLSKPAVLNPLQKANHIHQYWGKHLYHDALAHAEEIYKEYYQEMYGNGVPKPAAVNNIVRGSHKLMNLMWELSDNDDDMMTSTPTASSSTYDPAKPWLQDFNAYLNLKDHLGGQFIVQWLDSEERESWNTMIEDVEDDGLDSNVDDTKDAEVQILTLDEI
ncbi:uncharacterized protein EDB91DRAFT_1085113 [Suillus paluster]|uniref:uncharacterized protein n=1 Tax=Suillus paluster TaxID=48578 RepID=UPI001B861096|nr:uncharacterized protein EDB91DRAFT_1085113 [Suillus paluster]KAG1731358.1 hypothetical protein EDB91DRAFT_1085113 [Suillus paluster]